MPRKSLILVVLLVSATGLEANAQAGVFVEQPAHWGNLVRVVRPEYPPELLKSRTTGSVDIEGVIEGSGRLGNVSYKPRGPSSDGFVASLRVVVPFWQFTPTPGADCQPDGKTVSARVDFEIDAGEPRIFVTRPPGSRSAAQAMKPVRTVRPNYPRAMQLRAVEGRAYARADVDASGSVVAVSAKAYPRRPPVAVNLAQARSHAPPALAPPKAGAPAELPQESEQALKRWFFPPAPERAAANRAFCAEFLFDLPR